MSTERLTNLPTLAAMLILIAALLLLQRRSPRIAIGSWLLALGLLFSSQMSWYFTWYGTKFYAPAHTYRLCVDLLTGMALLLFTGRPLTQLPKGQLVLLWNIVPLLVLEVLYGMEIFRPVPYLFCAAGGALVSIMVAVLLRRGWTIPAVQVVAWGAIAWFCSEGNYRAGAYIGLGITYAAAALHIWFRLRKGSLGRLGIVGSLSMWSFSFLVHPWILGTRFRGLGDEIWDMQKFWITMAMLIFLLEEEISENAQLALHDQLTGLPNRRLMEQRLLEAVGLGRATVLLMDVDGFKEINDSMGHLAGDEILCKAAARLSSLLEEGETLARLGGDEFLIISAREADVVSSAIAGAFREPVVLGDGSRVQVGISVGSSAFPEDARDATDRDALHYLLQAADRRMYGLKRARKGERRQMGGQQAATARS